MNPNAMQSRVYVGIKGSVVALDATTGSQVWATHLLGSEAVIVVVQGERLYATTNGEIFCLNAINGEGVWHNKLKGFGRGIAAIGVSDESIPPVAAALLAERQRQAAAAAANASAATV